jgi:hypothetical protein
LAILNPFRSRENLLTLTVAHSTLLHDPPLPTTTTSLRVKVLILLVSPVCPGLRSSDLSSSPQRLRNVLKMLDWTTISTSSNRRRNRHSLRSVVSSPNSPILATRTLQATPLSLDSLCMAARELRAAKVQNLHLWTMYHQRSLFHLRVKRCIEMHERFSFYPSTLY